MMGKDFTEKELNEAKSQICFNICSHYDEKFSIKNPEKSIVKMTVEGDLPPWFIDVITDEFSKD